LFFGVAELAPAVSLSRAQDAGRDHRVSPLRGGPVMTSILARRHFT
jgi:hypothetical protein